jgi:tetratricopeptide (TPR) repeat protein
MRDVAYHTLVQKRRQELHLQTARAIADLYPSDEYVEIIAYHYSKTEEHAEAAEWLERAGDREAAIYASETAIGNYQEARTRQERSGGASTTLARLDEKLGAALFIVGRYDEAIPVLDRSVEIYRESRDLEGAARAAASLGRALTQHGTAQEGLTRVEALMDLLTWSGPSPALASLHLALGGILQSLGRYEAMLAAAERAAEIAGAIGDERLLASAMERRGIALSNLRRLDEAGAALEEAVLLLDRVGDLRGLISALGNLGEVHRIRGELHDARHFKDRGLGIAERIGNPDLVAYFLVNLGEVLLSLGAWEEARDYFNRAGEVLSALPSASATGKWIPALLGQVLLAMGKWEEAAVALQQALGMAEAREEREALELIHSTLGELEVLRGEPEAAIRRLEPLAGREGGFRVLIETTLAWALLEAGEETRAGELAGKAAAQGRAQGERLALVDALRVLGTALGKQGKRDEAAADLKEGLALARSLPYPYAEASILVEMGMLEEALAIFRRLGASKDIERTEQELAAHSGA